jgi:Zn-dependent peptidase ImmA (M78 family)/DNA-binding XRE family transcriptional regulator
VPDGPNLVVTDAAVEASQLFSAYRLQVARQARGFTKSDLSKRLEMSAAALSQFELGQNRPSPASIERLSSVLNFAPSFFSTGTVLSAADQADDEVVDSFGHFRSLRSVSATRRRQLLTVAHLLRDVTAFLETHVKLPELDVPHHEAESPEDIASVAAEVRSELGVDSADPIEDVLRLLERRGIVCARYPMDAADVSAFSVPMERRTFLVLKQQREAKRDRDRFSSCHELGHLVMHESGQALASKALERQADIFASEFLMPKESIRGELPSKVDWPRLLQLKQRWGVSMAALLYRSKSLGIMPETTYVQAVRTMNVRGWRKNEPGTVAAIEAPRLLSAAISVTDFTEADVSAATGWPEDMVSELFAESTDARPSVQL